MSTTTASEPRPPAKVQPPSSPDAAHLLTVVVCVVTVSALYLAREVLVPITLAVLLSFVLAPVVRLLRRLKLPRVLAVLLAVLLALGVITLIGSVIGGQIASLARDAPHYQSAIQEKVETVQSTIFGRISEISRRLNNGGGSPAERPPASAPAPADAAPPAQAPRPASPAPAPGRRASAAPSRWRSALANPRRSTWCRNSSRPCLGRWRRPSSS